MKEVGEKEEEGEELEEWEEEVEDWGEAASCNIPCYLSLIGIS